MDEITDTERIQPVRDVIKHLESHDFNWNDVYLSTTTPGQKYIGKFAGRKGEDFFFRDEQDRIVVGKTRDLAADPRSGDHIEFTAT